MNTLKKYWFPGILILLVGIFLIYFTIAYGKSRNSSPEDLDLLQKQKAYSAEQDQIMAAMMEKMETEPSGNASVNFLEGMLPHHASAIEMSESYLKYGGGNSRLKRLAEDIIQTQTDEIDQMKLLIEEIKSSGETDVKKEEGYQNAYQKMMSGHQHMHHGSGTAANVEEAFAAGMMMHHQMAVDMSEAVLAYSDHPQVRTLAESIIRTQKEEIEEMQEILEDLNS